MDREFKPFHDTYRTIMYLLSFGMVYPNPATEKWRRLALVIVFTTILPISLIVFLDIRQCWVDGNILEVIRHIAMIGPFMVGIIKMCLMYYKRAAAKKMLDIINSDYNNYNNLAENYKTLVRSYILNTLTYQWIWIICVLIILSTFVLTTTLYNMYEYFFRSEPQRHMIYDVNLPNKEPGTQLETPYFEILYFYMLYVALIYVVNFTWYDGFMITCVNHACLRIELFCRYVEDAMKCHGQELRRRMAYAINYQSDTFQLIGMCQSTFNTYLGMIYIVITTELCVCLYLITEGYEFDYKFTSFSIGTILHIYVPCRIADKLKNVCEEASTLLYCCGWETMYDLPVRRYIPFMLTRAQTPVALKGFGIVTYEMDLFVSTVKTAYSLYTLIKTQ